MIVPLLVMAAAGQVVAAPPAPTPATLQQHFDAATAASLEGRCADAIREFDLVEAKGASRQSALLAAAIDVRKGICLAKTGRPGEGENAIRRGLPVLIANGSEFAVDVRNARLTLGNIAEWKLDYDVAEREYLAAIEVSQGTGQISPLLGLSRIRMFDHDGRALAAAAEARTLVLATREYGKKDVADVQTQYARVLLNEGRYQEAYKELKDSLAKQGGLTNRVNLADIATRSDLAIAAMQTKDMDGARKYLAYTGAGRMPDSPFNRASVMDPPACGGEARLSPQDYAIVQFTLEEDGRVSGVAPIFTNGSRPAALAFAHAVSDWSWRSEDVKKIPLLFRYSSRVEMRCVKAPDPPSLTKPLQDEVEAWLLTKAVGEPEWGNISDAAALPLQRAALARAQAVNDGAATLQAALALVSSPVTAKDERAASLATAETTVARLSAPAPVQTYTALIALQSDEKSVAAYRKGLRELLVRAESTGDPLGAATLRSLIAAPKYPAGPADARALLDAVMAEPAIPANHPLKIAAMLAEANLLAAAGDLPGAHAIFDRTGLTAEQCALVGLQPALKHSGISSSDYPDEALSMGFEGWVKTEFDIAPDGRTIAPRAITAYPPFVFDDAATGIARDSRYRSTFRPEGALACSGERQTVNFKMP